VISSASTTSSALDQNSFTSAAKEPEQAEEGNTKRQAAPQISRGSQVRKALQHGQRTGRVVSRMHPASAITHSIVAKIAIGVLACAVVAAGATGTIRAIASHTQAPQPGHALNASHTQPRIVTRPVPPTTTTCPASGSARAAIIASLALGHDNTFVYIDNSSGTSARLQRYDVVTGSTSTILTEANTTIANAQLSADGQWILFVTSSLDTSNPSLFVVRSAQIQMVRMDGQGLQTLYCYTNAPLTILGSPRPSEPGVALSPDQQHIAFVDNNIVYTLNMKSDQIQKAVTAIPQGNFAATAYGSPPPAGETAQYFAPLNWMDATHLYLTGIYADGFGVNAKNLYLLDIRQGTISDASALKLVASPISLASWDFDVDATGTNLYLSQCPDATPTGPSSLPCTIAQIPASGGPATTIYSTTSGSIGVVRVINKTTLLSYMSTNGTNSGWWRLKSDGSGATYLTDRGSNPTHGPTADTNEYSHSPWASISRDGRYYLSYTPALTGSGSNELAGLLFAPVAGGGPTLIASASPVQGKAPIPDTLIPAGWTTN
jgi:hypothetical protein